MKKIIFALLFVLAVAPQVFARGYRSDATTQGTEYRSAFFMRATQGYSTFSIEEEYEYDIGTESLDAYTVDLELDLGISIRRLFALYVGADFSSGSGSISYNTSKYTSDYDITLIKFGMDLGVVLYPFRSVPVLRGAMFGTGFGFGGTFANYVDYDENQPVDNFTLTWKFELGYLWNVGRKVSLGVVSNVKVALLAGAGEDGESLTGTSVGIAFTVMRR